MVQLQSLTCALLPIITKTYIFLESESQIKTFPETSDYVGNLAVNDVNQGPGSLRMLSSASRPKNSLPLSPTEKKKEFLSKLVGYFQPGTRAENFINYGCWCFNDDSDAQWCSPRATKDTVSVCNCYVACSPLQGIPCLAARWVSAAVAERTEYRQLPRIALL